VLTAQSIDRRSPTDAGRWRGFLQQIQPIAAVAGAIAHAPPPALEGAGGAPWWRWISLGRRAQRAGRAGLVRAARWGPMSIADVTAEWFTDELLRTAIAAHAIFGNPAGPYSGGTGGMWLQRLAADPLPAGSGATARGGPGALTAALAEAAVRAGVSIRTDARVERILVTDGRAAGVVLAGGEEIRARVVVAAIDPRQALLDLVDPMAIAPSVRERVRRYRARGVTAKINLALAGEPVFRALHGDRVPLAGRLLVAPSLDYLERAYDAVKYGRFSEAPWLEISMPSVPDPALAPPGRHVMSICAHFAPRELRAASWSAARDGLSKAVIDVLEAHAPGFRSLVLAQEVITPEDLEREWGLSGGHIFHGESALDQSWIARPLLGLARYCMPVGGLFLAGAGAHPGGGLTGLPGLLGAKAVAAALKR
jgi:phytoene dehydrogenase-like protein